jgi:cysteine desulfurase/selenocysteine lyase
MDFYGIPATVRASLGLYNTKEEIDALVSGIQTVKEILG